MEGKKFREGGDGFYLFLPPHVCGGGFTHGSLNVGRRIFIWRESVQTRSIVHLEMEMLANGSSLYSRKDPPNSITAAVTSFLPGAAAAGIRMGVGEKRNGMSSVTHGTIILGGVGPAAVLLRPTDRRDMMSSPTKGKDERGRKCPSERNKRRKQLNLFLSLRKICICSETSDGFFRLFLFERVFFIRGRSHA